MSQKGSKKSVGKKPNPNWPSKTKEKSGKRRGNNPPKKKSN
jgi:hypothetical protein